MGNVEKLPEIRFETPVSVRESILTALRRSIISGQLKPGQRITERMLSEHFKTSAMPVKEALRILEAEGLIETVARKGTYVSSIANIHLIEIYTLRAILEGYAANLAAQKATQKEINTMESLLERSRQLILSKDYSNLISNNTKLHMYIREITRNALLEHFIERILAYDLIFRQVVLTSIEEQQRGWDEHKDVVEAIKNRQPEEAEKRLRQHIVRSGEKVLSMRDDRLRVNPK